MTHKIDEFQMFQSNLITWRFFIYIYMTWGLAKNAEFTFNNSLLIEIRQFEPFFISNFTERREEIMNTKIKFYPNCRLHFLIRINQEKFIWKLVWSCPQSTTLVSFKKWIPTNNEKFATHEYTKITRSS